MSSLLLALSVLIGQTSTPAPNPPGPTVQLKLRTGGELAGIVVDHDEHALLILHERTPYVFSWRELEFSSTYAAKTALLQSASASKKLSAADHFSLGEFALRFDRNDLADEQFRSASKLDRTFEPRIRRAWEDFRRRREAQPADVFDAADQTPSEIPSDVPALDIPPEQTREQLSVAYRTFGAKVQELMGKDIVLVESEHFLIWTDWELKQRARLTTWAEAMYAALREQFALGATDEVFPAKCPIFCFRAKARFRKFARTFDSYDGGSAVGYTRGIERHGHVHVVLVRQGTTRDDLDRFACTLVHEGTHAFLHRLYSHQLLPPWVNEGLAELTAERVLGDRCDTGETAALLAKNFARHNWLLGDFIESSGPVDVPQYALAHSLIAYLNSIGRDKLTAFIRELKSGRTTAESLAAAFDGLTPVRLEEDWRAAHRPVSAAP